MAATVNQTQQALEHYRLRADVCRVLTDPKRVMLIAALRAGERSVGEFALEIGAALPNASQHLAILRTAGLVEGRRLGTTVVYRLAEPAITDACDIDAPSVRAIAEEAKARLGRAIDALAAGA